jgi:hypothetical protein
LADNEGSRQFAGNTHPSAEGLAPQGKLRGFFVRQ